MTSYYINQPLTIGDRRYMPGDVVTDETFGGVSTDRLVRNKMVSKLPEQNDKAIGHPTDIVIERTPEQLERTHPDVLVVKAETSGVRAVEADEELLQELGEPQPLPEESQRMAELVLDPMDEGAPPAKDDKPRGSGPAKAESPKAEGPPKQESAPSTPRPPATGKADGPHTHEVTPSKPAQAPKKD